VSIQNKELFVPLSRLYRIDIMQKYSVNQQLIETVLAWVKAGEIAIPEIQHPFVWLCFWHELEADDGEI
jgi:hypothetical protein